MAGRAKTGAASKAKKGSKSANKQTERTKEQRIDAEERRLTNLYKDIEQKRRLTVRGLIERAAYMRVTLQDLEKDLDEKGIWELFSQGDQTPYERKRPAADFYNQVNNSYQKIIKQLTDLLPKEDPVPKDEKGDGFDEFVVKRE